MVFVWDESFMVRVPAIDLQHKLLIETFNDLEEAIETHKASLEIKKILNFLRYYSDWHFCREELCAEKLGCPIGDANKQAHKKFGEVFDGLIKNICTTPVKKSSTEPIKNCPIGSSGMC